MRAALLLCFLTSTAYASKAVKTTAVGCVRGGAFYSVRDGHAYRYSIAKLDLAPFEGKHVSMKGSLLPGDRFILDDGAKPEVKAASCPAAATRAIVRIEAMDLRLAAGRAAEAKEFDKAIELSNQAIALVTPADCDAHVDRGTIFAQAGKLAEARVDLAIVKSRKKCAVEKDRKMNFLLLQDLATELLAKGDKVSAISALELALLSCDTDLCRPDIKKALAEAKKK